MAKPWEQYQQPAGPWTQYQQAEAPADTTQPSEIPTGRTWLQTGKEAIYNIGPSAVKFAKGAAEALASPVETAQQLGEIFTGAYARFIPQEWMARPDKAQEFIAKANAVGGMYRDRYGSVDALKNTIATDPVGFLGDVSTIAGVGEATFPGRAGMIAGKTAAFTDPLRPVTSVVKAGGRLTSNAIETALRGGKANVLMEAAEGRAPEIINALRAQNLQIVPGSAPTAGEATATLGMGRDGKPVTRYAALQESAQKILPSEYAQRAKQQDAARLAAIREVGGTELQLDTARKIREADASTNYGKADKQVVESDSTFDSLLSRPSMDKVMARARNIAAEKKQPFVIGETAPARVEKSMILSAEGTPATETVIPATSAKYPVQSLHAMKLAFDDLIRDPATFGIGKAEAGAISGTRKEFLKWVEGKADAYRVARETFAEQSKPINQMEVGQYLESKMKSALQGENKLRAGPFATAVEAAPTTITRATGVPMGFKSLSDVLTPDQIKIVESIRDDLARQAEFEGMAAKGKAAGPQASKAGSSTLEEAFGGTQVPNTLNMITTFANAILKRLAIKIDRKTAIDIATEMLDPNAAANAMEKAMRKADIIGTPINVLRTAGGGALRAVTPAGSINAMAQPQRR
jgi:hypothetical protein